MTREQMFLLQEKAYKRIERDQKFQANLHGAKMKNQGLDTDGAIPIESVMNSGRSKM